jgi:hypothetical protein
MASMEFTISNPDHPEQVARVGYHPRRGGAYVDIAWNGTVVTFDAGDVDSGRDPIAEIVEHLASWGFVEPVTLDALRAWLSTPSCWRRRPPKRVRRVLALLRDLDTP